MTGSLVAALFAVAAVAVQLALPGRAVYHAGWYNVFVAALVVVTIAASRKPWHAAPTASRRAAIVVLLVGASTVGAAGIASGLLGPDDVTIVGAPGQRVPVEGLGVLSFPFAAAENSPSVTLERPRRSPVAIGARPRYAGSFVLRTSLRDVAYVETRDLRGNRMTVTQPEGSSFLSPVLLMQHRQNIAGLDLPYDSFNVPAARRVVKAVLFSPAPAEMLLRAHARPGETAVLFAVDDENDKLLPNAIGISAGGRTVAAGGLLLRATVARYPAVAVVSSPNIVATVAGIVLVLAAALIVST